MSLRAGGERKDIRLPKTFLELVTNLDPQVEELSKKDLLILKGDEDPLVPWTASQDFVSRLPSDKTEVVGYPGVGHAYPQAMLEKFTEWVVQWRRRH